MKISKIPNLGRFGRFIDGLDFDDLSSEDWRSIGKQHLQDLVTIIRQPKNVSGDRYMDLVRQWGPFKSVQKSHWMKKYGVIFDALKPETWQHLPLDPEDRLYLESTSEMLEPTAGGNYLKRVTGKKTADGKPMGVFSSGYVDWHSNESSFITFSPCVSLLGGQFMRDSATSFCQTVDYYESVSDSFRRELDDMIVIHRYREGGINEAEKTDPETRIQVKLGFVPVDDAEVPLVVTSPGGIRGVHYPVNSVYQIKDMSKAESDRLFDKINSEIFSSSNVFDYWWENDNDWLLFDNSVCLHRRIGGHPERVGYRLQYDPSLLLDRPWEPWHQPMVRERYHREIKQLVDLMGMKDFKLPSNDSYLVQE